MIRRYAGSDFFYSDSFRFDIYTVQFDEADFEFHRHSFSEIVIVLKAFGKHITDFGAEELFTGDVFVFNGEMGHGFAGAEGLLLCNIIYDPEQMIHSVHDDISSSTGFQSLFRYDPEYLARGAFHSRLQLSVDKLIRLEEMLATMQLEYASKRGGFQTMLQANFMRLVVFLSRMYQSQTNNRSASALSGVMRHINEYYLESLTVAELASVANMSTSHFMRVFKSCFATSPIDYVIRLRLLHSCELLRETSESVSVIADRVGFKDSNYFTRQFKRTVGGTPTQYRRNMQFADPMNISEIKRNYPEPA